MGKRLGRGQVRRAAETRSADLCQRASIDGVKVIKTTLFTDAACPWAYSANPALRVLEWRYGDQLAWRLVMIGLRDEVSEHARSSYDPGRATTRHTLFRSRYAMPFGLVPKERAAATGRGCRAVVAARLVDPGSEWRVLRALQLGNFTTSLLLDDDEQIREALGALSGIDADAIVDRLDDDEVVQAYERDRTEARSAAGTAAEAQSKTSTSDGPVRFTAPSVVFERDGQRLVAGGWQPILAYDVLLANLEPELDRTPPPDTPEPLLERFADGLTTAEAAALLAEGPDYIPDLDGAERSLLQLVGDGLASRVPFGQDAVWRSALPVEAVEKEKSAAATV
jgi:2-hydroxychromene-2-carboxylate isomerase